MRDDALSEIRSLLKKVQETDMSYADLEEIAFEIEGARKIFVGIMSSFDAEYREVKKQLEPENEALRKYRDQYGDSPLYSVIVLHEEATSILEDMSSGWKSLLSEPRALTSPARRTRRPRSSSLS